VLFAAGNDGDHSGFTSLDSAAYLKNSLAVGTAATMPAAMAAYVSGPESLRRPNAPLAFCRPAAQAGGETRAAACAFNKKKAQLNPEW
jgi:hypothetical protein